MNDNPEQQPTGAETAGDDARDAERKRRDDLARRIRENPGEALKSEFSASFLALLDKGGLSIAVSTYQAGQAVFPRADEGKLNTQLVNKVSLPRRKP